MPLVKSMLMSSKYATVPVEVPLGQVMVLVTLEVRLPSLVSVYCTQMAGAFMFQRFKSSSFSLARASATFM